MTARKFRRARWKPGALFDVPLADDRLGIAQAIAPMMENVIYVALLSDLIESPSESLPPISRGNVISLVATWRQSLNNGSWASLGVDDLLVNKHEFPNERFASNGYIGAKHYAVGILQEFLSAYHGLIPWNSMEDESYFDTLLGPGIDRPANVVVLPPGERQKYRESPTGPAS